MLLLARLKTTSASVLGKTTSASVFSKLIKLLAFLFFQKGGRRRLAGLVLVRSGRPVYSGIPLRGSVNARQAWLASFISWSLCQGTWDCAERHPFADW